MSPAARRGGIGVWLAAAALAVAAGLATAQTKAPAASAASSPKFIDPARGPTPILESTRQERMTNWVNNDERRPRNYDMQPPTIPHRVDGYQIDRNFNKCLDCHARERTGFTNAIPVSPTHYLNRAGKVLPTISTRRYFCMQCHVAQEPVQPIVRNDFQDVDTVVRNSAQAAPKKK